ncbi:MAG TPA: hypothetical protein PKK26_03320 [Candidatus Wallbacteria bacterium]|nr:hypothetical protein [Candidatus Wallbacteria bacterium]
MSKYMIVLIIIGLIISLPARAAATMPGFPEPAWYFVSTELLKPCKINETGTIRFIFKPLMNADLEVTAKIVMPETVKITGEKTVAIKSSQMKPVHADFNFSVTKETIENGYIEFTTTYPAEKLVEIVTRKYSDKLSESKKMIEMITRKNKKYTSSVPINLFVTNSECALNPQGYFEKNSSDLFILKITMNIDEAKTYSESFKMRYLEIFEMKIDEFISFIKNTKCDYDVDLSNFLLAQCVIDEKINSQAKYVPISLINPILLFEQIKYLNNFNKTEPNFQIIRYNINSTLINMVSYFNYFYINEFKKGNKKEAYNKMAEFIKIINAQKIDETLKKRLGAYICYNAGVMAKALRNPEYVNHFKSAASMNNGIIIR